MNAAEAVQRYREIAPRLPTATFPKETRTARHLLDLVDDIDCFVLDGFGVLNVGVEPVPGASTQLAELQKRGKQLRVLTNGASFPSSFTTKKYRGWGMHFDEAHVVSSRDALAAHLSQREDDLLWGVAAFPDSGIEQFSVRTVLLGDDPQVYERVDGFILLGAGLWTMQRQQLLVAALKHHARPLLVGNPDLVAPHADSFSDEPGLFAHAIADLGLAEPEFYGKPFANAFVAVNRTIQGIPPERIAMVGDTLHTDILGGAAMGWKTVLVINHGILRDLDPEAEVLAAGIRPDYIVPTT
ncbi:MAG: HAD hydrolase-like protein [Granulosicoccus sp.]